MKKDKNKILKYRVTYLEMIKHPGYSYPNCPIKFTNIIKSNNVPYWYFISLYKSVGEEYEWTDMLKKKKEITENFLNNKNVYFYSLISSGVPIGFFILDYRKKEICDISYIGLTKGNLGKGLGKYLFKTAFLMAWDTNYINKLTVNTCTLDHKAALPLYQKLGFEPVRFEDKKKMKTFFN